MSALCRSSLVTPLARFRMFTTSYGAGLARLLARNVSRLRGFDQGLRSGWTIADSNCTVPAGTPRVSFALYLVLRAACSWQRQSPSCLSSWRASRPTNAVAHLALQGAGGPKTRGAVLCTVSPDRPSHASSSVVMFSPGRQDETDESLTAEFPPSPFRILRSGTLSGSMGPP